jgi:hypothetical protein
MIPNGKYSQLNGLPECDEFSRNSVICGKTGSPQTGSLPLLQIYDAVTLRGLTSRKGVLKYRKFRRNPSLRLGPLRDVPGL